jgi:hypothetical protein
MTPKREEPPHHRAALPSHQQDDDNNQCTRPVCTCWFTDDPHFFTWTEDDDRAREALAARGEALIDQTLRRLRLRDRRVVA